MLALLGWAVVRSAVAAPWLEWLVALVLGFVGFYLFWRLLDWALIVVTSLSGAILASISLTSLFGFAHGLGILPFLMFFVAGALYQARDRRMALALQQLRLQVSPPPADVPLPAPWPSAGQPAALPPPAANADATADTPGDAAASLAISG